MSKYKIQMTTKFKKDYNKMRSRNNFDENEFKIVIELLSNGELLPENIEQSFFIMFVYFILIISKISQPLKSNILLLNIFL